MSHLAAPSLIVIKSLGHYVFIKRHHRITASLLLVISFDTDPNDGRYAQMT
jgi:hypothetical protein